MRPSGSAANWSGTRDRAAVRPQAVSRFDSDMVTVSELIAEGMEGIVMHPRLAPRAFRHPVSKETIRGDLLLSAGGITFVVAVLVFFVVIPLLGGASEVGGLRYNAS